jgi:carbonic anhydrase
MMRAGVKVWSQGFASAKLEQAIHVCQTTVVQDAWARGQRLAVHGWIYRLEDGLLRDLGLCVTSADELHPAAARAFALVESAG